MKGGILVQYIKRYPLRFIFLLLTIAVMVIIFLFSSENSDDSSDTSGNFTRIVINLFVGDYDELSPERQQEIWSEADHIIRKTAHFTIYMSLGFCASCAVGKRRAVSKKTAAVIGFCFFYACTDEIHQHFTPGRACRFTDVLIDTTGAFTGTIFSFIAMAAVGVLVTKLRQRKLKS